MLWFLIFGASLAILAYHRASLQVYALSFAILLFFFTHWHESWGVVIVGWLLFLLLFLPLLIIPFRRSLSFYLLNIYHRAMPTMSRTEKEALEAGTVSWEGDLFSGMPAWDKLLAIKPPQLTSEEEAFIQGPLEDLCSRIDDWDISHRRADLTPEVWGFIKQEGFFALLIPKEFGGRGFSYYACSQIQMKLEARSVTVGTTVSVPNSLGPAELLLHYGTPEQKNYYLPRLSTGEEVPCFALTSPDAGSDATAMTDYGIVCQAEFEGKKTLGIRLQWNKRYITLAPVATVIGLAFKLFDPDHLLGDKEDIGITCALIPRGTAGITIGRRHFPLNAPFQNGPIQGEDVFIPLDWIIGGPTMAGQGWRMLMECLAGGRGLSLPALVTGAAKAAVLSTSAYARIRRQFKQPIVHFEGVAAVLARMAGNLYTLESARRFILSALDSGEKPAVASAILKYHATEKSRTIGNDAMDIQGGKGIILGPKNILGRGYESIPIAITVEGANILTRNMIIFGQGAMRCHPYIIKEYAAATMSDQHQALIAFDQAFFAHGGFVLSNFFRTVLLSLSSGRMVKSPTSKLRRYYQHASRFSAGFAFLADVSLLVYGGSLKRKESISALLGDILSHLYLLSAILHHYYHQGEPEESLPLVEWAAQSCLYDIQQCIDEVLRNFSVALLRPLLRGLLFPWGRRFTKPHFSLAARIAGLFSSPTSTRQCLAGDVLLRNGNDLLGSFEKALLKVIEAEPVEKIIREKLRGKVRSVMSMKAQAEMAFEQRIISKDEYSLVVQAEELRQAIIAVDDFAAEELVHRG